MSLNKGSSLELLNSLLKQQVETLKQEKLRQEDQIKELNEKLEKKQKKHEKLVHSLQELNAELEQTKQQLQEEKIRSSSFEKKLMELEEESSRKIAELEKKLKEIEEFRATKVYESDSLSNASASGFSCAVPSSSSSPSSSSPVATLPLSPSVVKSPSPIVRPSASKSASFNERIDEKHRYELILQLLNIEKQYVSNLKHLIKSWLIPFREGAVDKLESGPSTQYKSSWLDIFCNVETIVAFSENVVLNLESRVSSWSFSSKVGDIFNDSKMDLYLKYIQNYPNAVAAVKILKEKKAFQSWIKIVRKEKGNDGFNLLTWIAMPVEHFSKYKYLLEELLECNEPESPEYVTITEALNRIQNIYVKVKDTQRDEKSIQILRQIQATFLGNITIIASENRNLIKEGHITIVGARTDKPVYFFLFDEMLIYASVPSNKRSPKRGTFKQRPESFIFHRSFDLKRGLKIIPLPDTLHLKHAFQLRHPQKTFTVFTETEEEKIEWLQALERVHISLETSEKTELTSETCFSCEKVFDELEIRSQKFCKRCAKLLCGDCSKLTIKISEFGSNPTRVCKMCFVACGGDLVMVNKGGGIPSSYSHGSLNKLLNSNSNGPKNRSSSFSSITKVSSKYIVKISVPNRLKITSAVDPTWTVSELIASVNKKFAPGETDGYSLFLLESKNSFRILELDKPISLYALDQKETEFIFDNPEKYENKGKGIYKKPTFGILKRRGSMSRSEIAENQARVLKRKEEIVAAIVSSNLKQLQVLLESHTRYPFFETLDENGTTPLHLAIQSKDPKISSTMISYYQQLKLDVNIKDSQGNIPLHVALSQNTEESVLKDLLHLPGIIIDMPNNVGNTPLHLAAQHLTIPSCIDLIKLILTKVPHCMNVTNKEGKTPFHLSVLNPAFSVPLVLFLIAKGTSINTLSLAKETALHIAIKNHNRDVIPVLISKGIDISIKNSEGFTAYELAKNLKDSTSVEALQNAQDLYDWLAKLDLSNYYESFVLDELYLDVISLFDDQVLTQLLYKFNILNKKDVFQKACDELKQQYAKKGFEDGMRKASNKKDLAKMDALTPEQLNQLKESLSKTPQMVSDKRLYWLISPSDLTFVKELGSGAFATVYKGTFRGKTVAIKVLNSQKNDVFLEQFAKEFEVMSMLQSPRIVNFYGACLEPRICIVMEYCKRGSLYSLLNSKIDLTWVKIFEFALDIASAISLLHSHKPPIFHRDLKSLNLLINKEWRVLLCDFGLARLGTESNLNTLTKIRGTYSYSAPELFNKGTTYTDKCDIYSIGIIFWEMFSRLVRGSYQAPFGEFNHLKLDYQIFYQASQNNLRPTIPSNVPAPITNLIKLCWDPLASNRPTANVLINELRNLQRSLVK